MIDQSSQFFATLTQVGEAKQANAIALGLEWTFAQMGVGDANSTDPVPDPAQRQLVNERRRAPLNQVRIDPANPNIIIAEQIIPPDAGGWWIREIGLYDVDGDLVAIANCAPSYKPLMSQGSGKTQVVRMNFIVTGTANVVLKIDPAVVLATREYVDSHLRESLAEREFKQSVLAASTGPTELSGERMLDDVGIPAGSRVLIKDQLLAKENGLYLTAAGPWLRTHDANSVKTLTAGLVVKVQRGTRQADTVWQLVSDALVQPGVTPLAFEMLAGPTGVDAGSYRSVTLDRYGRALAGSNPTTRDEYGLVDVYTQQEVLDMLPLRGVLVFDAPGVHDFEVPPRITRLDVQVWGAGGAGGNAGSPGSGGGGGAGAYARGLAFVLPGQRYVVTVGAGGEVRADQTSGGSGSASSFGDLLTATGGQGGTSHYAGSAGGLGGQAWGANLGSWPGACGDSGVYWNTNAGSQLSCTGGSGGGPSGGRGGAGNGNINRGGVAIAGGMNSGGGGAGTSDAQLGEAAAGGPGQVIITW